MDEDRRRREYILNIILAGSLVMLAFFDALVLYYTVSEGVAYHEVSFWLFTSIFLFFVLLYLLSRRGFPVFASYLLIGAYLASNTYAAYQWGVDLHIVVLSYALIVLIASILIGTWFGFVTAGIIAAVIIPLRYFQLTGAIPLQPRVDDVMDAVTLAIVIFLIMTLAWLWNRELGKSLRRAHASESELEKERDLLEIRVEERTHALRQAQFERVEQLYQFAEFGQLASGLFHDLLNLVNAASLQMETKISMDKATVMSKRVERFVTAVRRQLDRQEAQELFPLAESIEDVIQLLSYKAMKEKVNIIFPERGDRSLAYFGNPFKFHQVAMNLIFNALEAYDGIPHGREGRIISIELKSEGGAVRFAVEDKGSGIPDDVRSKIFEPFFSTKESSKGMGIGLASVKRIVEKDFDGMIFVESEVGEGSRFIVVFPWVK
ncbi:MAG: HAMP domain-containing histidine kinase [Patescibacteria group bacterium]|nr:HAMP domain-containing histidine kinase [Patescibacteria group bacterium]